MLASMVLQQLYACQHGVAAAVRHFSGKFAVKVGASSVQYNYQEGLCQSIKGKAGSPGV